MTSVVATCAVRSHLNYKELSILEHIGAPGTDCARYEVFGQQKTVKCRQSNCPLWPTGTPAAARIEGPRGEVLFVASDGIDIPRRVKVRTPSLLNMPAVRVMLQGASLADGPLIQASIDTRYSCTDR